MKALFNYKKVEIFHLVVLLRKPYLTPYLFNNKYLFPEFYIQDNGNDI